MGVQTAFNYQAWVARFPEFADVAQPLVQEYWNEACIYHRNDGSGPIGDPAVQTTLLNLVAAHICKMNAPLRGEPSPDAVGRVATASEGSVSVSLQMDLPPGSAQWWNITKYGAAYWLASAPFRQMRYRGGRQRNFNPWLWPRGW
jgi:hypothetical protein